MTAVDDRLALVAKGSLASLVSPNPEGAAFWRGLAEHRLVLPNCRRCQAPFFYPRVICPRCGSRDLDTVDASGTGTLYSFCVHFHTALAPLAVAVPFATALVDLAEGPRVMGFLVGVPDDPEQIAGGVAVHAEYLDAADATLLTFRPDGR